MAYYYLDDNGQIVVTTKKQDIPNPSSVPAYDTLPDSSFDVPLLHGESSELRSGSLSLDRDIQTVSSGDFVDNASSGAVPYVLSVPSIDYNLLQDSVSEAVLQASLSAFDIYPNSQAVSLFRDVLNSLTGDFSYIIISPDSSTTDLYYSYDYDVSSLHFDYRSATLCRYHFYRPSMSSGYLYQYSVSDVGDVSFDINGQIVYTNSVEGYPDVFPYKSRETYGISVLTFLVLGILVILLFKRPFTRR